MIPTISKLGLPLIFAFILGEGIISFRRKDRVYSRKDTLANVGISLGNNLLGGLVWVALALKCYAWGYALAPFQMPMDRVWSWLLLVVAADLAWYVEHRVSHGVRMLWAIHSVHHSSEKYNYSIALRLPWLGGLTRIPFLLPLAFLGFPPVAVYSGFSIVFLYQIWVHTTYVGRLGVLEKVMNTPSHHRVHHGSNQDYLDKNYGGIFIIWDRLFGTFQREEAPVTYGILHPIASFNPLVINTRDLYAATRDALAATSLKDALKAAFGNPSASVS